MTSRTAVRIVQNIILENCENGELEGIFNRGRIAALNRVLRLAQSKSRRLSPTRRRKDLSRPNKMI
jgi:hypothetical protein